MVCSPFKWLFNQEAVAFLLPQKKVRKKEVAAAQTDALDATAWKEWGGILTVKK